jgi:hypothetical protein
MTCLLAIGVILIALMKETTSRLVTGAYITFLARVPYLAYLILIQRALTIFPSRVHIQ